MDRNALKYLVDLNQHCDEALSALKKLAEYPELEKEDFTIYQTCFREYLADANLMVLDALEQSEEECMSETNRIRLAFEKSARDPDDCYFDVLRREEERRNAGLPPLIGVLRGMHRTTKENVLHGPLDEEKIEAKCPEAADFKEPRV
jgi:hypothetical protein